MNNNTQKTTSGHDLSYHVTCFVLQRLQLKMPGENSFTTSHLSVSLTTQSDEDQTTGGNTVPSSSSNAASFYFQCAVVIIGVVGAAANGLIVYAMVASKQHTKQLLIFNQNVFDLCSCIVLVITYALKLCRILLVGTLGYWLCVLIIGQGLVWCSINGSAMNLMSITVERYVKVVYPSLSKKLLRKWVIWLVVAFTWIAGTIYSITMAFSISVVIDGVCYYTVWKSEVAWLVHSIWYFISFFLVVIFIFTFCYWRILVIVRRQASVMAGHSAPGPSAVQTHSIHIQISLIKTMTFVCAFYVVTWLPLNVYFMLIDFSMVAYIESLVSVLTFVSFFYISANPFIYAMKFYPVRQVLASLIPCKNTQQQPDGRSTELTGTRHVQEQK